MIPIESLFVITAVAAVVELLRRLNVRDFFAAATILASAVVGALAGAFNLEGLDVATGILAGLSASGLITVVSKVGNGVPRV